MWLFIQNQVLGMQWLNEVVAAILQYAGVDVQSRVDGSLQFFFYDVVKITVLLCVLIFLISYIQSYFPPERSRKIMGRFRGIWANIMGALLGTVTPFCSCSSIPLFMGFTSAGLPLGVTFSFLISSPMVDLGSLVLLISIFGYRIAVAYVVFGLIIAVIGGSVIERLHMEAEIEDFIRQAPAVSEAEIPQLTRRDRLDYAKEQMTSTFRKVFPYILIGVGIGALIHNWIPEQWRNPGHPGRGTDVCRYLWLYPHCRSLAGEGGAVRRRIELHDGRDDAESAFAYLAAKSHQAEIVRRLYPDLRHRNHLGRLQFQRPSGISIVR